MLQQLNDVQQATIAGLMHNEWLQNNMNTEIKKWDTLLGSLKKAFDLATLKESGYMNSADVLEKWVGKAKGAKGAKSQGQVNAIREGFVPACFVAALAGFNTDTGTIIQNRPPACSMRARCCLTAGTTTNITTF